MATMNAAAESQVVGKVISICGTVKAIAPDVTVRLLAPDSPVFANDRIVTESDGNVSIMFADAPGSRIDLGRMSSLTVDEDVYAGVDSDLVSDASAEAGQIKKVLMDGDAPINLETSRDTSGSAEYFLCLQYRDTIPINPGNAWYGEKLLFKSR